MTAHPAVRSLAVAALFWAALPVPAADVIEISLEQFRAGEWRGADARTVFNPKDEIRFRFRTSFTGYLYVWNKSSGGDGVWLYPRQDGDSNRVEAGVEYTVPAKGRFVVGGPAGFDITSWLVSARPLDLRPAATVAAEPGTLRPRCRDDVLRSRGLCMDDRAGPQPAAELEKLRRDLGAPDLKARDLTFQNDTGQSRISSPEGAAGFVVYEFRIAHN